MQPYRLEVAVKRVYGLGPLLASSAAKIAVEVRFLDFPPIVIHPQGYAVGDTVAYNVCHKADFRMSAEQVGATFPATCQCQLVVGEDRSAAAPVARWACPCALLPYLDTTGASPARSYANYIIGNAVGEVVGYAEMSCRVLALEMPASPAHARPAPVLAHPPAQPPVVAAAATPTSPPAPSMGPSSASRVTAASAEQGKPYIVRVVVGESDRGPRRSGQPAQPHPGSASAPGDGPRHLPANTAEKGSLLHLLQYDVAYQLQSLSETVAAVLQREHDVLNRTPLRAADSGDAAAGVSTATLTRSIDHHVAAIVKLANIILQVANQLVDSSPAPARVGTSRELTELARQRRNPVNKLPAPGEGSVAHYLQYEVLYQLQCLGTNLSYVTLAYRTALDTPLASLPAQHVEYCDELGREIQHLTKRLNILVQSSVDGTLGTATPPPPAAPPARDRERKERKAAPPAAHPSVAEPPATGPALLVPRRSGYARVPGGSSYSSFSSRSSSSSGSSLSSSSLSSMNKAVLYAPPPPPPPPLVVPPAPAPPATPSPPSLTPPPPAPATQQQQQQPYAQLPAYTFPASTTSPASAASTTPPPPTYAAAAAAAPAVSMLPTPVASQGRLPPSIFIDSFAAPSTVTQLAPLASPVSWIHPASSQPPPPPPNAPLMLSPSTAATDVANAYRAENSTSLFAPPPPPGLTSGGGFVVPAPFMGGAPPPLPAPSPLTPPRAQRMLAAAKLATPPPVQAPPSVPLPIPIPVPFQR